MVIPMPAMQAPTRAPSAEWLGRLKVCVCGLWVAAVGRILFGNPGKALQLTFMAVSGTLILKDDEHLKNCHQALMTTPLEVCLAGRDGLACLTPFLFLAGITGVFDLMELFQVLSVESGGVEVFSPVHLLLLALSVFCEWGGVYLAWQMWKQGMDPAGGYAAPGNNAARYDSPDDEQPPAPRQQNFELFAGSGHRLGG
jgi:hypothetical protein